MTLGKRIKDIRMRLGLNQTELAKRAGVTQATLSRYEDNLVPYPRMQVLLRIAAALDASPEYLINGKGSQHLASESGQINDLVNICKDLSPEAVSMLVAAAKALKK